MADIRNDTGDVTLINFEGLTEKAQMGVIDGLNLAAVDFAARLAEQLPPGVSVNAIVIKPARGDGNTYTVSVGIEDKGILKWLWGYWKGVPNIVEIYPRVARALRFSRWRNGPNDLRDKDGYFNFKHVSHEYLPHDFVEQAIAKFDTLGERIISKMKERLGNG
jgi:hypothetical protein